MPGAGRGEAHATDDCAGLRRARRDGAHRPAVPGLAGRIMKWLRGIIARWLWRRRWPSAALPLDDDAMERDRIFRFAEKHSGFTDPDEFLEDGWSLKRWPR